MSDDRPVPQHQLREEALQGIRDVMDLSLPVGKGGDAPGSSVAVRLEFGADSDWLQLDAGAPSPSDVRVTVIRPEADDRSAIPSATLPGDEIIPYLVEIGLVGTAAQGIIGNRTDAGVVTIVKRTVQLVRDRGRSAPTDKEQAVARPAGDRGRGLPKANHHARRSEEGEETE